MKRNIKKKISVLLLCGVILLNVCGCSKNEKEVNSAVGTYNVSVSIDENGTLKLFENGDCYIERWDNSGNSKRIMDSSVSCTYNILNNEITISYEIYKNHNNANCTISKNGIVCERLPYLSKFEGKLWKK